MFHSDDSITLARRLEANEIAAWRAMYRSPAPDIAAPLGIFHQEAHGALLIGNRAAPVFLFNRVIGLGVFEPADDAVIDRLLERARAERIPAYVHGTPLAQPPDLAERLEARGLARAPTWLMHQRALDGELPPIVSPDGYRCEIVTSAAAAAAWSDALLAAWGVPVGAAAGALALTIPLVQNPAFVCFAAIEQASGHIVGGGMLFMAGGVAGLYADGVRPEHRHHNLQDALIAMRLAEARRRGCDTAFSQTLANHPAQHNMAQAGFTIAYERLNYVLPK